MPFEDVSRYGDIIDLPHHRSHRHPPMSRESRAAQFIPFAALTGYGDVIEDTARRAAEDAARADAAGDPFEDGTATDGSPA